MRCRIFRFLKPKRIAVVSLMVLVAGFVIWYANRPHDSVKMERVEDADFALAVVGVEGWLFRYSGGLIDCWFEEDADGNKTILESIPISTEITPLFYKGSPPREFKHGLVFVRQLSGDQGDIWEVSHRWDLLMEGGWTGMSGKQIRLTIRPPKGNFTLVTAGGAWSGNQMLNGRSLLSLEGRDANGRPWSVALKCRPVPLPATQ